MGTPTKRLRTDLGVELHDTKAKTNNLHARLEAVGSHPYVKRDEAEDLIEQMDRLEQSMHDLKDSLLEEDWKE